MARNQSSGQYLVQAQLLVSDTRELEALSRHEVKIAPRSTTICGSDLHYFFHGKNGAIVPSEPLCLGHESSGEVVAVGEAVHNVKVGDRVAIESGVPCSICDLCDEGRYNLCTKLRFRGSGAAVPPFQGMLQEQIIHPNRWIHCLPSTLTYEDGALLEPLAVALHAVRRAAVRPQQQCLIFGAGAVGLLCAAAAKFSGCGPITMADVDEGRLAFAIREGFAEKSHIVKSQKGTDLDANLTRARELAYTIQQSCYASGLSFSRPECTFECTGVEACVQASIYVTRSGGRVLLVGMGTPNQMLPISEASAREIDLIPTWRYADCYPEAINMMVKSKSVKSGLPNLSKIITHRFNGLETVPQAFKAARGTRDVDGNLVIKVTVNVQEQK